MTRTLTAPARHRFTREDYHRMGDTGILPPDARVELLNGEVVEMSPIGPFHGGVVDRLNDYFTPRLAGRAICRVQGAITLDDFSEPEPDIAILKRRPDYYTSAHPRPEDVLLVIEVAESSIDYDLDEKLRAYAEAGIPDYWVFDLKRRILIVHRAPAGGVYTSVQEYAATDRVSPLAFPDLSLEVAAFVS